MILSSFVLKTTKVCKFIPLWIIKEKISPIPSLQIFFPAFSYFLKKAGFRSLYKYLIKQFEQTIATYTQQTFITQAGSMETIITTWGTQSTWAFTQPCAISILWPASRPTRGLAWPVPEAQTTHTYQTVHTILSPILCLEWVSKLRALRKLTVPNA